MPDECLCCDNLITSGLPVKDGLICSDCIYEIQTDRLLPTAEEIAAQRERVTARLEIDNVERP